MSRVVKIGEQRIGDGEFAVIAGPCAIESKEQLLTAARALKERGVKVMRACAYKPRTSPDAFQGMGQEGLDILAEVRSETGLATATEVVDPRHVQAAEKAADLLWVGARNMQNFELLKALAKSEKPVMVKNGLSATLKELLGAASYVQAEGKRDVLLCYRGIRTFETATRFAFDAGALFALKQKTDLPVIADPSHPAGDAALVPAIARAALAAGANGLLVEVHPNPPEAKSDAAQQLTFDQFAGLHGELKRLAPLFNRTI